MTWTARFVGGPLDNRTQTMSDADLDEYGEYVHDPGGFTGDMFTQVHNDRSRRLTRYERRENPDRDTDFLLVKRA